MLRERRGTCSIKHLFLAQALVERFPETEPLIVHRVYWLDRTRARELFDTRGDGGAIELAINILTAVLSTGLLASAWDIRNELLAALTDR